MIYQFYTRFARILNSSQSRSVVVTGNVYDLFCDGNDYVPLVQFLTNKTKPAGSIQIICEPNGPLKIIGPKEKQEEIQAKLMSAWAQFHSGMSVDEMSISEAKAIATAKRLGRQAEPIVEKWAAEFRRLWLETTNPTVAMEFLRQLCMAARSMKDFPAIHIYIVGADMVVPDGNVANLGENLVRRIYILQDWLSDPAFVNGKDTVVLIAESRSLLHTRIAKLPQIIPIEVDAPNKENRSHYIGTFLNTQKVDASAKVWEGKGDLATVTAGLSIYALRQMLLGMLYSGKPLDISIVVEKVQEYIQSQVGEDVVEFKKPTHCLKDIKGNADLKTFFQTVLLPGIMSTNSDEVIGGCAVSGGIGGGKTFIFEALAAELDMPVLVIKNVRSQWYGQTDVIFERLRRVLLALDKVGIFMDEADTQLGGVGADTHETERRLTGKIQQMMSDPALKGRVFWFLMTARIHLLSPDMRRPGRGGDLIIPVLDPEDSDREEFIAWVLEGVKCPAAAGQYELMARMLNTILPKDYSAASFQLLRKHLKTWRWQDGGFMDQLQVAVQDLIPSDIAVVRRYQTLQALMNCTRRCLLPRSMRSANTKELRQEWAKEIQDLEAQGVR